MIDAFILAILSQNTNDTNRDRAYDRLVSTFPSWEKALAARPKAIADAIRPGGLGDIKSVRIKQFLQWIKKTYGKLDLSFVHELEPEEVMRLFRGRPGIGVKTISVVLLFCCGRDIFPVDTHVNRLCNRLGLVKPGSSPEKTFEQMKPLVPKGKSLSLHVNLIRLGRALCRAQKPSCDECPIRERCEFGSGAGASKLS